MNIDNQNTTNCSNCGGKVVYPDHYSVVVVQNINERNQLSCNLRQNGTIAVVVEEGYAQYQIQTQDGFYGVCDNAAWIQISTGDKVFDGSNLIIINDEAHRQEYFLSGLAVPNQLVYFVPEERYYRYDGIGFVDANPEKLDKPSQFTDEPASKYIPVYDNELENPEWLPTNTLGKVESVNNVQATPGTKNIQLKVSDLPNDADYATNVDLTQVSGELDARIIEVEGINYTWNPTNRTLTLFDASGRQMSQVSLVSLDNEGTDLRYNAATRSLELYNSDGELIDTIPVYEFVGNVASALQLNSNTLQLRDSQGNVLSSVNFSVSNISGLQTALDAQTQALNTEITNRTNADNELQGQINTNAGAISAEETARANADALKLDKPTASITAVDTTWKYIPITDSTGNSRQILTTDLLKNIGNTDLTLTSARTLSQGAYAYTHATGGYAYNITGLPDKSADASFNSMLAINSAGQIAKSNGKNLLKGMPAAFTDAEKTAWKTEMNGGWTTNTMSIGMITPIVIKKANSNVWVTLRGVNLNLNPASFSVEVMDSAGSAVVATIPNSQVQLYTDGISLVFYYNFNALPNADYKIRLWNGVAYHTSPMSFVLTDSVNNINVGAITWNKITVADNSVISASGSSVSYTSNAANKAYANDLTIVAVAKSSKLFNAGQNFYLKLNITVANTHTGSTSGSVLSSHFLGLINNDSTLSLNNILNIYLNAGLTLYRKQNVLKINSISGSQRQATIDEAVNSIELHIIRQNGIITGLFVYNNVTWIGVLGNYDFDFAIGLANQNFSATCSVTMNVEEAYTF